MLTYVSYRASIPSILAIVFYLYDREGLSVKRPRFVPDAQSRGFPDSQWEIPFSSPFPSRAFLEAVTLGTTRHHCARSARLSTCVYVVVPFLQTISTLDSLSDKRIIDCRTAQCGIERLVSSLYYLIRRQHVR